MVRTQTLHQLKSYALLDVMPKFCYFCSSEVYQIADSVTLGIYSLGKNTHCCQVNKMIVITYYSAWHI